MKTKLLISLLVAAIVGMFISCDQGIFAKFKPNEELFEYTCYDKGSYWVYEDSATHKTDSLVVITKPIKTVTTADYGSDVTTKTFRFHYVYASEIVNIKDTFIFEPTVHGYLLRTDLGWNPEWYYTYPFPYNNNGKNFRGTYMLGYMNMPTPIDDSQGKNYCITNAMPWCDKYYQSYVVETNKYYDVKRIVTISNARDELYSGRSHFDSIVSYWARNIGVVRWECYDSTSSSIMNLVRYDVKNLKKKDLKK